MSPCIQAPALAFLLCPRAGPFYWGLGVSLIPVQCLFLTCPFLPSSIRGSVLLSHIPHSPSFSSLPASPGLTVSPVSSFGHCEATAMLTSPSLAPGLGLLEAGAFRDLCDLLPALLSLLSLWLPSAGASSQGRLICPGGGC